MSKLVPTEDLPDNLVPEDDLPDELLSPADAPISLGDKVLNMFGRGAWALPGLVGADHDTVQAAWSAVDLPGGEKLPGTFKERYKAAKAAANELSRRTDAENPIISGLVRGGAAAPGEALTWAAAPEVKLAQGAKFLQKALAYAPRMGTAAAMSEYGSTGYKPTLERTANAALTGAAAAMMGGAMAGVLPNPGVLGVNGTRPTKSTKGANRLDAWAVSQGRKALEGPEGRSPGSAMVPDEVVRTVLESDAIKPLRSVAKTAEAVQDALMSREGPVRAHDDALQSLVKDGVHGGDFRPLDLALRDAAYEAETNSINPNPRVEALEKVRQSLSNKWVDTAKKTYNAEGGALTAPVPEEARFRPPQELSADWLLELLEHSHKIGTDINRPAARIEVESRLNELLRPSSVRAGRNALNPANTTPEAYLRVAKELGALARESSNAVSKRYYQEIADKLSQAATSAIRYLEDTRGLPPTSSTVKLPPLDSSEGARARVDPRWLRNVIREAEGLADTHQGKPEGDAQQEVADLLNRYLQNKLHEQTPYNSTASNLDAVTKTGLADSEIKALKLALRTASEGAKRSKAVDEGPAVNLVKALTAMGAGGAVGHYAGGVPGALGLGSLSLAARYSKPYRASTLAWGANKGAALLDQMGKRTADRRMSLTPMAAAMIAALRGQQDEED